MNLKLNELTPDEPRTVRAGGREKWARVYPLKVAEETLRETKMPT